MNTCFFLKPVKQGFYGLANAADGNRQPLVDYQFKERAAKLAVQSDQPKAQTARDLGVSKHTLQTWIAKYHRAESSQKGENDEHVYVELQRLSKENARLKEERDILKTFHGAHGTPTCKRRNPDRCRLVVYPRGEAVRFFGGIDPVKKHDLGTAADLRVVTPSGDPG